MKAVIKTNDKKLFSAVLKFLRSLNITVELDDDKAKKNESNPKEKNATEFVSKRSGSLTTEHTERYRYNYLSQKYK
ncbi:MAG: hypothetical protein ABEH43_11520 [Flavobacteriales bacterium]